MATSKLYKMQMTKDITIEWQILGDNEHPDKDQDLLVYPKHLELKKDIDFVNTPLDEIFFQHFFPSVKGHAAIIDECYEDR